MEFVTNINTMLVDQLGPMGPLIAIGAAGILLILLTLPAMLNKKPEPFDKLRTQRNAEKAPKSQGLRHGSSTTEAKLDKFSTFLEPQNAEDLSASRLKLLRAGYRSKNAVRMFHFAQFILGICFLLIGVVYTLFAGNGEEVSTQTMILSTIGPGAAGYYLPQYWVQRRLQMRQEEITAGFPDALDMMLVCVEAGQSLDQSILRIARESRAGYPALADEFDTVANEVKAGKERVHVLKDMSERVGLPDVTSFVTTLVQSASFGTSISDALRVYSAEMRDKRVLRAEEKANTLPTKLTLGTMMFTLPPLLIILIGPAVHGISKSLGGG
jgi:tight adherence protein C